MAQARFPSSVLKCTGHLGVFGDSDEIPREGVSWRPRQGAPPQFSCFHLPPPAPRVSAFFPNVCGLLGPTDGYAHRQLPRDAPPRPGCTHGFRTRAGSSIPVPGGHVPGLLSQNPPPGHPQATARRERHLSEAGTWNAVGRGSLYLRGSKEYRKDHTETLEVPRELLGTVGDTRATVSHPPPTQGSRPDLSSHTRT